MQRLQLSSGDLVADRRADYALMLHEAGDHISAAGLMRDTLALVPGWVAGWYRLGEMLEALSEGSGASDAYREALRLDAADRLGAGLKLAAAGEVAVPASPPPAFVEALFDQYAPQFDGALVDRLEYRVPEVLSAALRAIPGRFTHLVDLGCGTGLMAERLTDRADFIEGVDISAGMLRQAERKRLYGRLTNADLASFEIPAKADLVTAADVLMYVGALDGLFSRLQILTSGAVAAFSVELHDGPDDFVLRPSRRYAHSRAYLRRLLEPCFRIVSMERATIRMDRGEPIEGLIVVARRS